MELITVREIFAQPDAYMDEYLQSVPKARSLLLHYLTGRL